MIAGNAQAVPARQQLDALIGMGAIADGIAQEPDAVVLSVAILQNSLKCWQVSVNIGDQQVAHGWQTSMSHTKTQRPHRALRICFAA